MVFSTGKPRWLLWLALGLWACGCAGGSSGLQKGGVPGGNAELEPPAPPPPPAPALYIPAAPKSMIQRTDFQTLEVPVPLAVVTEPKADEPTSAEAASEELPPLAPAIDSRTDLLFGPDEKKAVDPLSALRNLYRKAEEQIAPMDAYVLRLKRREVVNGRRQPEEIVLFKFRREPFSVYLKWLGNEAHGREVIYVKGRFDNLIHMLVAAGDIPLVPGGKRIALALDNLFVKSSSRHAITEAGLEHFVEHFGRLVDGLETKDPSAGSAHYLGQLKRPEFENDVEAVEQIVPPRAEPLLPRGGQRLWCFDSKNHLPVLLITKDESGQEVEYYCHDHIEFPAALGVDHFNPDQLWIAKP